MGYAIRMGIPEMEELWNSLQTQYRDGTISKKDEELYKKWGNALKQMTYEEVRHLYIPGGAESELCSEDVQECRIQDC